MKLTMYEKTVGYLIGWSEVMIDYVKNSYEEFAVCAAFPVTLVACLLACAVVMNYR